MATRNSAVQCIVFSFTRGYGMQMEELQWQSNFFFGSTVTPGDQPEISTLIRAWSDGDETALDRLTPLVYHELRRVARRYTRKQRGGDTLQTTALVHETWLRLVDAKSKDWEGRVHFY